MTHLNYHRLPLRLNANRIRTVVDITKKLFETDKVYALGRSAEVIRGLFPSTHFIQLFLVDETAEQVEKLNYNTLHHVIMKEEIYQFSDGRLGAFEGFNGTTDCIIYKQSDLAMPCMNEFLSQLKRGFTTDIKTGVKIPPFSLNHAFWQNNNFFHPETTAVMETVSEYLRSPLGVEEDIPLVGAMHRYLAPPKNERSEQLYNDIRVMLKGHRHEELLLSTFLETIAESN